MSVVKVWGCLPGNESPIDLSDEWQGKSINEIATSLDTGVYTTMRTYGQTKILGLRQHLDRLSESASLLGAAIDIGAFNLRQKMRIAIYASRFTENRIRIHIPLINEEPKAYLLLEELSIPSEKDYHDGVAVTTRRMQREQSQAKATSFISLAENIRNKQQPGVNEVLMISAEGRFLEGLSSNFFAVEKETIWTAGQGVLAGITREIILEIIKTKLFPIIFEGYLVDPLSDMREAFISSTSRGVLPVTRIDGSQISNGKPGPLTIEIMQAFEDDIKRRLESI